MRFFILFLFSINALAGIGGNQIIKQVDFIDGIKSDKNFVKNASFEDTTYDSSWTVTNGTQSLISSTPFGANAITITASSQASNLQSSTGTSSSQAGINCLVSAYIKTSLTNVRLCAINNGTLNASLCVNANPNNAWAQYQIPVVCDSTSTVARVEMSSSGTGSFSVDNVYIGVNPNISTIGQAQIAGESYFAGTANCTWDRVNTTVGAFTADADCPGPTVTNSGVGTWNTTDANLPIQTITNLPAGKYKATFQFHGYTTAGAYSVASINDGTTSCQPVYIMGNNSQTGNTVSCVFDYPTGKSSVSFQLYAASSANTFTIPNSGAIGTPSGAMKFNLEYYPSPSTVVSTNNQDYDWTAYTPTITGFGTATNIAFYHKRQGSDLLIRGRFTEGTTTATEARISLPSGLTSSSAITTLEIVGDAVVSTADTPSYYILVEPSVTYTTFGRQVTSTYAGLSKRNGNQMTSGGATYSYFARIPIQSWNNNNVIVGTFDILRESQVSLRTGNGHGSTNTKFRRWTNSTVTGTDLVYADSSTNGATITVQTAGVYSVAYHDIFSSASYFGISIDSSQGTINSYSATTTDFPMGVVSCPDNAGCNLAFTQKFTAGQVIRAHTAGSSNGINGTDEAKLIVTRIK